MVEKYYNGYSDAKKFNVNSSRDVSNTWQIVIDSGLWQVKKEKTFCVRARDGDLFS